MTNGTIYGQSNGNLAEGVNTSLAMRNIGMMAAATRIEGDGRMSDRQGFQIDTGVQLSADGEIVGANLGNADATITVAGGSWRILPPETLTANRTVQIDNTGAGDDETITIDRQDKENFTLTVKDNGGTNTLAVMPALTKMRGVFRKAAGANFVCEKLTRMSS